MTDNINHPSYYTGFSNGAEVIDITENLNFNRGNAIKYLARAGAKDPNRKLEDLRKAEWYVQREIQRLDPAPPAPRTVLHTDDHLKTIHEALCVASAAIGNFPDQPTNWPPYVKVLQNLINDIERQRPLGSNGKHGKLHTPTCQCEDKP